MNFDPALIEQVAAHVNALVDQVIYVIGIKLLGEGAGHLICSLILAYLARRLFKRYWTRAATKESPDLDMLATMLSGAVITICSVIWFLASTPKLAAGTSALIFPKGYAALEMLEAQVKLQEGVK